MKKKKGKTIEKVEAPVLTPAYIPFSVEHQYFKGYGEDKTFEEQQDYNAYISEGQPWEMRMK